MKRLRGLIILLVLFIAYIWQGGTLLINNKEIKLKNRNFLLENNYERNCDIDLEEVLNNISSIGLNVDNLKKDDNKVSVSAFISSSKEDIIDSLERLKDYKWLIETYNITKYDDIDVRFNLKIP
ncbi:MAG: hypothetical protein Q4B63_05870 [Clostridium perfringens]|nr:hypothetical protein [Clostridium perfringens]